MIKILDTRRLIMAVKTKPITSTPIITGKYAKQIIKEADVKPSKKALIRVKKLSNLMKKISK